MISTGGNTSRNEMLLPLKWSYKMASPHESDLRVYVLLFLWSGINFSY